MNNKGNDYFETPNFIFEQLDSIFNFTMDCAASLTNKKCKTFLSEEINAFKAKWIGRCFCNPPFSKKSEFIKKANEEVQNGNCSICVMILPLNSMDSKVWHEYIEGKYMYEILKGRISFIDPQTKKAKVKKISGLSSGLNTDLKIDKPVFDIEFELVRE